MKRIDEIEPDRRNELLRIMLSFSASFGGEDKVSLSRRGKRVGYMGDSKYPAKGK
jgi:hypothetical protein